MSCTDNFEGVGGKQVAFRGHTHPYAHGAISDGEFALDTLAIQARRDIFGSYVPEIVRTKDAAGNTVMRIIWGSGDGRYSITDENMKGAHDLPAIDFSVNKRAGSMRWTSTSGTSTVDINAVMAEGRTALTITRSTVEEPKAKAAKKSEAAEFFKSAAQELAMNVAQYHPDELKAFVEGLDKLAGELRALENSQGAMSARAIVERLALLLQQAGIHSGSIGVLIDARSGGYNEGIINSIITDIKKNPNSTTTVKYAFIVDKETPQSIQNMLDELDKKSGTVVLMKKGQDIGDALTEAQFGVRIGWTSIATPKAEDLIKYYEGLKNKDADSRINSLITPQKMGEDECPKIPAAALLTILIKLASQGQTTVMAVGCSQATVRDLQNALKTGFRFFNLARLEIDKLVGKFLTALHATSVAL